MPFDLDDVIRIAERAGEALRENFGSEEANAVVGIGKSGDITRLADTLAEGIIVEGIKELGDSRVLSEEAGVIDFGKPKVRWVVDPLDGSTNYARRIPTYAISILVQELPRKEPLYAVIYEPHYKRCFYAEAKKGAYLNGKRLETNKKRNFENCIFDLDLHFQAKAKRFMKFVEKFSKLGGHLVTFRSIGSCALALAYTAMGALDGFLDLSKNSRFLDIAAGVLILDEAGGKVTDAYGKAIAEEYDSVIACSSEELNRWLLGILQGQSS